ncbi:MAG TPA: nucleoside 2-deoxyribosyltransferase, partial [Candidatus Paceibacterota bacterium]
YFSGSIRGGREHDDFYAVIVKELGNFGEVLSEFVADKSLTSYGTLNMTEKEIYERDVSFVEEADIFIADVTVPSLGVGYEIAYAEKLNKDIYCLYNQIEGKRISAMIAGNPNCKIYSYQNKEEIPEIIKRIFK